MLIAAFSYVLEFTEDSIKTYGDGLWYCFAIVTTIGFGDFTAVTIAGRLLSVILGIYGIIVVALVTSIIINFYGEIKDVPDEDDEENDIHGDAEETGSDGDRTGSSDGDGTGSDKKDEIKGDK